MKAKVLLLLLVSGFIFLSCEEDCSKKGKGTLKVTNTSINTIQRVIVDGIDYGILEPGDSKDIELPEGNYPLLIEGVSGGGGCAVNPLPNVPIISCETFAVDCAG